MDNENSTSGLDAQVESSLNQLAVNCTTSFLIWFSEDGKVIHANEAAFEQFGFSPSTLSNLKWDYFFPRIPFSFLTQTTQTCPKKFTTEISTSSDEELRLELTVQWLTVDKERRLFCSADAVSSDETTQELLRQTYFTIENASIGVFWYDQCGDILNANRYIADLLGYTIDELKTFNISDIDPNYTREQLRKMLSRTASMIRNAPKTAQIQSSHRTRQGELVPVEIFSKSYFHEGKPFFCAFVTDLRTRKKIEFDLWKAKIAIDDSKEGIVWYDRSGNHMYVNDKYCTMLGYSEEELLAMHCLEISKTMTLEEATSLFEQCERDGSVRFETTKICKDGNTVTIEAAANYHLFEGQKFFCCFVRDVTEEKAGAIHNAELLSATQETIQNSPDAVFWINLQDDSLAFVNLSACQTLGYTEAELLKMKMSDIDPDYIQKKTFSQESGQRGHELIRTFHITKSGKPIPVEVSAHKFKLDEQTVICSIARDVSERTASEKKLGELNSQLAHVNRLQSMGEMASAIAHELNQPLAAISNNAYLLRKHIDSEPVDLDKTSQLANMISDHAILSGEIVHRLRGFVSDRETHREPANVNEIILESLKLLETQIRHSKIEIRIQLVKTLAPVKADRVQIQQVIVNLLLNAIEAIRESPQIKTKGEISVKTFEENGAVAIEIGDNGPGIPDLHMASLFEPFFTTKTDGMGMGLAISKSIVENHWGEMNVSSSEFGTLFQIVLPFEVPHLVS